MEGGREEGRDSVYEIEREEERKIEKQDWERFYGHRERESDY